MKKIFLISFLAMAATFQAGWNFASDDKSENEIEIVKPKKRKKKVVT